MTFSVLANISKDRGCLRQFGKTRRQVDRFCCLGVLCNIVDPSKWKSPTETDIASGLTCYRYQTEGATLPNKVLKKIGLNRDEEQILIVMNDAGNRNFSKIAKYLEKTYLI